MYPQNHMASNPLNQSTHYMSSSGYPLVKGLGSPVLVKVYIIPHFGSRSMIRQSWSGSNNSATMNSTGIQV